MSGIPLRPAALADRLRSAIIYFSIVVGLRPFSKREIGQFTIFNLVLLLLIANAVQPAMTAPGYRRRA